MQTPEHKQVSPLDNILIIGGNAAVLVGVLLWEWSLFDVFYVYWLENVIIGVITAARMLMLAAAWGPAMIFATLFFVAFFTVHYGMFCFAHGMILFDIFYKGPIHVGRDPILMFDYMFSGQSNGLFFAVLGMVLIDTIRGLQQYSQDKKEGTIPQTIMFSPYGRIIILHVTILFGGLAAQSLGTPIWALILLIVLKTSYDLGVHNYKFSMPKPRK